MKPCICFGICLSSKWFYLKLSFLLFSNLGLIKAQQTHFYGKGWHITCHSTSKMHIVGKGPGVTPSALRCVSYLINSLLTDKRWEYQTTWPVSWETYMQVRKQQLELDMEQQTDSKSEKEYAKAVYSHPAYVTYMQSTSWKCWAGGSTS